MVVFLTRQPRYVSAMHTFLRNVVVPEVGQGSVETRMRTRTRTRTRKSAKLKSNIIVPIPGPRHLRAPVGPSSRPVRDWLWYAMRAHALLDLAVALVFLLAPQLWIYSGYAGCSATPSALIVRTFGAALLMVAVLSWFHTREQLPLVLYAKIYWSAALFCATIIEAITYAAHGQWAPWLVWLQMAIFGAGSLTWVYALHYEWRRTERRL